MAEYKTIIPVLLKSLEKPTHCRGIVSEEQLHAVFQKIMEEVEKKRPDCHDNEKQFLAERTAWNWAWKTKAQDAAGLWIIDPPFSGKLDYLASEIAEIYLERTIPQPSTISRPSLTMPQPSSTIVQPSSTIMQPSPTIRQPIPTISQGNPLPDLQNLSMAERVARAPSPHPGPWLNACGCVLRHQNTVRSHCAWAWRLNVRCCVVD